MVDSIPVLDLSLASGPKREQFLLDLRHALVNVGFFLLVNFNHEGPSESDFEAIYQQTLDFFALPAEVKNDIEMIKSPHFLGYTKLANEITAKQTDWREQVDLATELPAPGKDEPLYKQLEGPNLWPDEKHIPQFRPVVTSYIEKMTHLSAVVRSLLCEAIGLPPTALDGYFKENQQCKMKIIAYPDTSQLSGAKSHSLSDSPSSGQGVGPHRDSDFLTFIYQATPHEKSLWVQNFKGDWIPVPNIKNSLVVNAGQTLEAITNGVCKASIHQVTIPEAGSGTRISIPFFQTINLDSFRKAVDDIPDDVKQLQIERDQKIEKWGVDVGFQFKPDLNKHAVGYAVFRNRIKAHQDVAKRWYPEILEQVLAEY